MFSLPAVIRAQPARLPLKLLLTAEAFGFGPSAAIAQIFKFLREYVHTIAFAGTGHTLDIQRPLYYD